MFSLIAPWLFLSHTGLYFLDGSLWTSSWDSISPSDTHNIFRPSIMPVTKDTPRRVRIQRLCPPSKGLTSFQLSDVQIPWFSEPSGTQSDRSVKSRHAGVNGFHGWKTHAVKIQFSRLRGPWFRPCRTSQKIPVRPWTRLLQVALWPMPMNGALSRWSCDGSWCQQSVSSLGLQWWSERLLPIFF
jgi:hypothetical protein